MVQRISKLNDPFEVMYRPVGEMNRKIARQHVSDGRFLLAYAAQLQAQNPFLDRKSVLRLAKAGRASCAKALTKEFEAVKRACLEKREAMVDRVLRVACFTNSEKVRPQDEILMWSHYADGHTGIRLGFEFPPGIKSPFYVKEIVYAQERIELDITLFITNKPAFEDRLMECTKTKGIGWAYEHEFRLFTHPKFCHRESLPKGDFIDFVNIQKSWLRAVDFGARCPESTMTAVTELVKTEYSHVLLRQAKYHSTDYDLRFEHA